MKIARLVNCLIFEVRIRLRFGPLDPDDFICN